MVTVFPLEGCKVVAVEMNQIFPHKKIVVPIEQIDQCFGTYGQCLTPDGEPAELQKVVWDEASGGGTSWASVRARRSVSDGICSKVFIMTLNRSVLCEFAPAKEEVHAA